MAPDNLGPTPLVSAKIAKAHALGLQIAETTGDQKADQSRILNEKGNLGCEIAAQYLGPIKPDENQTDATIAAELEEAEDALRRADAKHECKLRDWQKAESEVPAEEPPPKPSAYVMLGAALAMGTTFAASIYDISVVAEIDDTEMRFIVAAVIGVCVAWTAIASLYNVSEYDPQASVVRPKQASNVWSVVAGILMVAAFGFIRFSTTDSDAVLTVGLMALDAALLSYVKFSAMQHRNKLQVHAERNDGRIQTMKRAQDAKAAYEQAQIQLVNAKAAYRIAIQKRDERLQHDFDVAAVTAAVFAAFQQGYYEGLDNNRNPRSASRAA
jgi:hypothetical protein